MNEVIAWLLAFMVTAAPPGRKQFYPDAIETKEEASARYQSIAADIVAVAWNPDVKPLFGGPNGRARTATMVLSIMLHESAFRRDVDFGLGKAGRGDHGRSWCLMQVQTGTGRTIPWNKEKKRFYKYSDPKDEVVQGWTGSELVTDRRKCIEAGIRVIGASFASCHHLPVSEWLRVYASGNCEDGSDASRRRMYTGINWYSRHAPPLSDAAIMDAMRPQPPEATSLLSD